jgi:heme exporter protein D
VSFATFSEFLAMGDHGLYVWLSYGVALIMVVYNVVSVRVRQRRALQAVRDSARRDAARRAQSRQDTLRADPQHEQGGADAAAMTGESEVR